LLDEPLGALDLKLRQEMQIELKQIQKDVGITFVYVTHDQEEALTMSDRLAVMSNGQIEQIGVPVDVYERPATEFVAGFIGMTTRYLVHLERGETLVAVRQNMDALGDAQKFEGRPVRLAWSKEHTFVLEKGR